MTEENVYPKISVEWVVDYYTSEDKEHIQQALNEMLPDILECLMFSKYLFVKKKREVSLDILLDFSTDVTWKYDPLILLVFYDGASKKFDITLNDVFDDLCGRVHIEPLGTFTKEDDEAIWQLIRQALKSHG